MQTYRKVPIPILETERLVLRPLTLDDAPRIQALFPHFAVLKYMASVIPWPYPENGAAEFVASILPAIETGDKYFWAILPREDFASGLIGVIGLTPDNEEDHRGFWLGEAYWGRGYMKEASTVVNDFAFGVLGMEFMILNNAEANLASHRLKELAGAEVIERGERDYVGGRLPNVTWKLTAEAWAANRDKFPPIRER